MTSAHDTWIELADRESDGVEVSLLWSRSSGCIRVIVTDTKLVQGFELDVARADALEAFYHPFAYAASAATSLDRTSTDLQLQS